MYSWLSSYPTTLAKVEYTPEWWEDLRRILPRTVCMSSIQVVPGIKDNTIPLIVGAPFMELSPTLSKRIRQCDAPLILFLLVLYFPGSEVSHANALLINKETQEYERFEPMGVIPVRRLQRQQSQVDYWLTTTFRVYAGLEDYTYYPPEEICPLVGPQPRSEQGITTKGLCYQWSLLYLQTRALYPQASHDEIFALLIDTPQATIARYAHYLHDKLGWPLIPP